jgi:hypothetical protein
MPLKKTFQDTPPAVSARSYVVAGIEVVVQGLEELQPEAKSITCLWMLHPRLDTKDTMAPLAATMIREWNGRIEKGKAGMRPVGLIAVSFDQRNHGGRLTSKIANETWRDGNANHAQDMFSTYREIVST